MLRSSLTTSSGAQRCGADSVFLRNCNWFPSLCVVPAATAASGQSQDSGVPLVDRIVIDIRTILVSYPCRIAVIDTYAI